MSMNEFSMHEHAWVEVHLDQIKTNIIEIRRRLPSQVKFMAAVKANGYGHGLVPVARAALQAGADALAVGLLNEAIQLREAKIDVPILVLTPVRPERVNYAADLNISLTVFQAEWLKAMRSYKTTSSPLHIHLKMDTGLGRLGMREQAEFNSMLPHLLAEDIVVEGVYTHLATANQADRTYCEQQYARFIEMREWVTRAGFQHFISHCSNSAAALQHPGLSLDMVRVGAAIYGIHNCDPEVWEELPIELQPTLSVHATVVHVKKVSRGERLGYDNSYIAEQDEWIATVALGYADGCFRGYHTHMLVKGEFAPIIGNICMEQVMLRLPRYYPAGTKVTLLGRQGDKEINMYELAAQIDSIPQQVLTMLSPRLPRVYLDSDTADDQAQL